MALDQILKQIKEVKPFADADAEAGPIETLAGRRGRKVQAIERMKILKREYIADLLGTAQFIIVTGSLSDKLTETLTAGDKGLFSADPEQFYSDLASRVNPALYQGKSTVHDLFDVLGRHLEDKANELDIVGYPQLIFKERYVRHIGSPQQFTELVKTAINEQVGSEVVGIQAVNSIVDKAIEKSHASKSTSIVLNVKDLELANALVRDFDRLRGTKTFLIVAGEGLEPQRDPSVYPNLVVDVKIEEVNKETVKTVLNYLKGKKNG